VAFFLDTNTCIYALKGRYPAIGLRMGRMSPASIKIPSIVKAELLFGARKSREPERALEVLERFLFPFEIMPFGDAAAALYSRIRLDLERRGKPVGPNDLIVAATVMANRGTLVTHNVREFARISDLSLEDWTAG
jgi:tRNA(fMet)-specific endonuclease VapC